MFVVLEVLIFFGLFFFIYLFYFQNGKCLEERTFYRIVSGLHSSITIHLCRYHLNIQQNCITRLQFLPTSEYSSAVQYTLCSYMIYSIRYYCNHKAVKTLELLRICLPWIFTFLSKGCSDCTFHDFVILSTQFLKKANYLKTFLIYLCSTLLLLGTIC